MLICSVMPYRLSKEELSQCTCRVVRVCSLHQYLTLHKPTVAESSWTDVVGRAGRRKNGQISLPTNSNGVSDAGCRNKKSGASNKQTLADAVPVSTSPHPWHSKRRSLSQCRNCAACGSLFYSPSAVRREDSRQIKRGAARLSTSHSGHCRIPEHSMAACIQSRVSVSLFESSGRNRTW